MIHTSPYFTPPKWARLRSPYFSSYFSPFYPFVCVFSYSCILSPNACWVVDCLKYLEVCRHDIIPREPGDQPSRLRLVVWKTTTQRHFSDVSLLPFYFISRRRRCTLSKCHIDSRFKCDVSGIYILLNLQLVEIHTVVIQLIGAALKRFMQSHWCLPLGNYAYLAHDTHTHIMYIYDMQENRSFPFYKFTLGITSASYFHAHKVSLATWPVNRQMSFKCSDRPESL